MRAFRRTGRVSFTPHSPPPAPFARRPRALALDVRQGPLGAPGEVVVRHEGGHGNGQTGGRGDEGLRHTARDRVGLVDAARGHDAEREDHAGHGPEETEQGRQGDDRVEHGQVAGEARLLLVGGRFHGERGRRVAMPDARREHARDGGPGAVPHAQGGVPLRASGVAQDALGVGRGAGPPPEPRALEDDRERHHGADQEGRHDDAALDQKCDDARQHAPTSPPPRAAANVSNPTSITASALRARRRVDSVPGLRRVREG